MKHGAIVPNIIRMRRQFGMSHIGEMPAHSLRARSQSMLSQIESSLRDIEDGDILVSMR